jgi:uncharacterized integral membrane protein
MQYIRYAFLGVLGIVLISVSLANRNPVTLRLMPEDLAGFIGVDFTITLPLFVVVLAGIAAGLVIGFVWEWMREYRHRRDVGRKTREVQQLERELSRLKVQKNKGKDDVLALLEDAG